MNLEVTVSSLHQMKQKNRSKYMSAIKGLFLAIAEIERVGEGNLSVTGTIRVGRNLGPEVTVREPSDLGLLKKGKSKRPEQR